MTADLPFRDGELLQLLQLQTRRAIAQRVAEAGQGSSGDANAMAQSSGMPDRWRLLPEEGNLFSWQDQALRLWMEACRGTVKVATGAGKTWFALAVAQELQRSREADLRLVIVVPTIPLMHQWADDLRSSNLPPEAIGLLGGGRHFDFTGPVHVAVCVLNSARRFLPDLVRRAKVAGKLLLVVDECHRSHAEQSRKIFDIGARYTLGLSATPESSDADESRAADEAYAESPPGMALGPIVYEMNLAQALEAGLLAPFEVHHIGVPLSGKEGAEYQRLSKKIADLRKELQAVHRRSRSKQPFIAWCQTRAARGGAGADAAASFVGLAGERKRLLYRASRRIEAALGLLTSSVETPDSRAILFHEVIDQVEHLFQQAVAAGLPVVAEHSKLPASLREDALDAFRRGVARVVVSAKSLVEGFNVPSADVGVIAASSSSVRQRIQSLGRMLRRKEGGRTAVVSVLYVRGTEDERIYEEADWNEITGASRNRFFHWEPEQGQAWPEGRVEVPEPPRPYLPPSAKVDSKGMGPGDPWPAQARGEDLKVDPDGNLRGPDGAVVPLNPSLVAQIVEWNPYRRARLTPTEVVICRVDGGKEAEWVFVGLAGPGAEQGREDTPPKKVATDPEGAGEQVVEYRLKQARGVRRIVRGRKGRGEVFARAGDQAENQAAGRAAERLLAWVAGLEREKGRKIHSLYWDGRQRYWVEIEGTRLEHPGDLPEMEFPD